jgi:putative lipoic acid-binding regulatory protein
MDSVMHGPDGESFDPQDIKFPVSFEMRIIILADHAASLPASVASALDRLKVAHGPFSLDLTQGKKYGKARLSVTFMDSEALRAAYAAVGAVPGVKAVI